MTAEKTDLQKLEALLHSATNERQRKMYQALLSKAQTSLVSSASTSSEQQTTQSLTKTNKPQASTHSTVRGKSSKNKAGSTNNSTKKSIASNTSKRKSQTVKENTGSTKKTTNEKKKKSTISNANSVTEIQQHQETKTEVKAEAQKQSKQKTRQDGDIDKAKTAEIYQSNESSASPPPASSTEPAIFQAVGILKGIPCLEDGELFVKIDEQKFRVEKKIEASRRQINLLKSQLDQNGSREMLLRVYPNVSYNPKNKTPNHLFRLIRSYVYSEQHDQYREGFTIRGIWRHIPHGDNTVITIHRNIARLEAFKQLPRSIKKPFVKAQDLPVIWADAPVEPFIYHPERSDSEQMPCYFVQVRAAFKDGLYVVEEMLEEPTLDIPPYIQRPPKNRQPRQHSTKPTSKSNKATVS